MPIPTAQEEAMAPYRTIVLELIQEQPELHERLRLSRTLLSTVDSYATELRTAHLAWMDDLRQANPDSDPSRIASEAMERAVEELRDRLRSGSPATEADPLSLDAAMSFIRSHSPPA
jgi:hypothetical protein